MTEQQYQALVRAVGDACIEILRKEREHETLQKGEKKSAG